MKNMNRIELEKLRVEQLKIETETTKSLEIEKEKNVAESKDNGENKNGINSRPANIQLLRSC